MSGRRERVDRNMNHYYAEERDEQGWRPQPDVNREGSHQSWTGDSAEATHWASAAPIQHQSSTAGEGWDIRSRHIPEFDSRAVTGHQYPEMASGSISSMVPVDGYLPHSQAFLDRPGMLLAPGIPYQSATYNLRFVYRQIVASIIEV